MIPTRLIRVVGRSKKRTSQTNASAGCSNKIMPTRDALIFGRARVIINQPIAWLVIP